MSQRLGSTARTAVRREVVSFVRRSARMNPRQTRAWDAYADRWLVDVPRAATKTSIDPACSIDLAQLFGRRAPLVVEIGPGMGSSLVAMARQRSHCNVLAFEVFQPAVAQILARLGDTGTENVRVIQADAVDGLTTVVPTASVSELWLFFPDPWPKFRHAKRRLVTPAFVDLAASVLQPSGVWRLATDWADYTTQMRRVLDEHPAFDAEDPTEAILWEGGRPVTRFEQRGRDAGRQITDLRYRRLPVTPSGTGVGGTSP